MNLFKTVKQSVSVPDAAKRYGIEANRHGMARCPFHDDRHPSLKLNPEYYYCFGCGATGDVIDFAARLFGLGVYEAAKKLAADFDLDPDKPPPAAALVKPKHSMIRAFREDESYCQRVLCDYLHLLEDWKLRCAPVSIQSYQCQLYVRFLCFGNGALTALHDRSDGFFRRQIVLTTKDRPADRVDDPYLVEKMAAEKEGIFLWCLEGLTRLIANNYQFTISDKAKKNIRAAIKDANNIIEFLGSEGYLSFNEDSIASTKALYEAYKAWCDDNAENTLSNKSFANQMAQLAERYGLKPDNNIYIGRGKRCRGYHGVEVIDPDNPFLEP